MADGPTITGAGGILLQREADLDHTPSVTSIAVDPRGRYLLTGGPFGARLWWAASGEAVRSMKEGARGKAVFAASGRLVVGTGPTVWDVETGDRIQRPEGAATDEVLAVDAEGGRVLTKDGGRLSLWAIPAYERIWSIGDSDDDEQELSRVHCAAFHAGGDRVVTAGFVGGTARPAVADRSTTDGRILRRFVVENEVYAIALDGEKRVLLGVMTDRQRRMVRLVDLETGALDPRSAQAPESSRATYAIVITPVPGSTLAVVGDRDGEMSVLDLANGGSRMLSTRAHDGWISALAFLPDGRLVSAGGYDGRVRFWRLGFPKS